MNHYTEKLSADMKIKNMSHADLRAIYEFSSMQVDYFKKQLKLYEGGSGGLVQDLFKNHKMYKDICYKITQEFVARVNDLYNEEV